MKFSEKWLREWVSPDLDTGELAHRLTMIGHEVDAVEPHGVGLEGVKVGEILQVRPHPDADRLRLCTVTTGAETFEVVCGAPNVRPAMKAPFAPVGTRLPNGVKLRRAKIRGVESYGMLCSAIELGLGDEADGILELAEDAETGAALTDHLDLPDYSLDLDLTPNRGDCFSVLGIARDVAAMADIPVKDADVVPVAPSIKDQQPVELAYPERCPRFVGRVVRNLQIGAESPRWLKERLLRSGLRPIQPVVDVTNYVMMELGQPLHAYDLGRLTGTIRPRLARNGEQLTLLDEKTVELSTETLVISDDSGAIGLAGIMGGLSTAVTLDTTDVFLEAAFFPPAVMAGQARKYGLHTDASMRFERGVDPTQQSRAIERATQLLLDIAGGDPGPVDDHHVTSCLPPKASLPLRKSRLAKILGIEIDAAEVLSILENLGFDAVETADGWTVGIPSYRFDMDVEDALVEEVARIFGYDRIPEVTAAAGTPLATVPEAHIILDEVADLLVARDYQEVITYSFIDDATNTLIYGKPSSIKLDNPISSEMSVMRSSVWPGLLRAASQNLARQQDRVRFFEIGKTFHGTLDKVRETVRVAGIAAGNQFKEHWDGRPQAVDFFDIKADVEALIKMTNAADDFEFVAATHPALHPGQTANILRDGEVVGVVGTLHPAIARNFQIENRALLFEIDAEKMFAAKLPNAKSISKFPSIRRDIAVVVENEISAGQLIRAAETAAPELVQSVRIFDIYTGPGIEAGRKSVALGLILQETSRTLTDDDADAATTAVLRKLQQDFAAVLRD